MTVRSDQIGGRYITTSECRVPLPHALPHKGEGAENHHLDVEVHPIEMCESDTPQAGRGEANACVDSTQTHPALVMHAALSRPADRHEGHETRLGRRVAPAMAGARLARCNRPGADG